MPRGLVVLGVLAVPLIVLELIGKEQKREHRVRGAGRWAGRPRGQHLVHELRRRDRRSEAELGSFKDVGGRLKPTSGWKFRTKVLEQDLVPTADNGAVNINVDELANTYDLVGGPYSNYKPSGARQDAGLRRRMTLPPGVRESSGDRQSPG